MRGIVAGCAEAIDEADKFLCRAACAEQGSLAGNFIIGEQAARPGRLTTRSGCPIHRTVDFLAHFINGGQ